MLWSRRIRRYANFASFSMLAAPLVAGLAAYMRSLPSKWQDQLEEPENVKKMITLFHRRFAIDRKLNVEPRDRKPIIWNGQVGGKSCLTHYDTRNEWDTDNVCPDIEEELVGQVDNGQTVRPCDAGEGGNPAQRQEDGGSCPLIPGGDAGARSHTIEFITGPTAAPTCTSGTGCGGHLREGYYCAINPTGAPPDYHDPKDPNAGNPVLTTTIDPPPGPTDGPTQPICDDQCKLDLGFPCNCNEDGCDRTLPSCCIDASCPVCRCSETGCFPGWNSSLASDHGQEAAGVTGPVDLLENQSPTRTRSQSQTSRRTPLY